MFFDLLRRSVDRNIAEEISESARYADEFVQVTPHPNDTMNIFKLVDAPRKRVELNLAELGKQNEQSEDRRILFLNGNLNYSLDIQSLLRVLNGSTGRHSRIMLVIYNSYLSGVYRLLSWMRLMKGTLPSCFITQSHLQNFTKLEGLEIVRSTYRGLPFLGYGRFGRFLDRIFVCIPIVRNLALVSVITMRSTKAWEKSYPSLSIIVPARNEFGNIENLCTRLPKFPCDIEIIFIEGHSTDQTWTEILRVKEKYASQFSISAYQQSGKGKNDAVQLGFSKASKDLLIILDADLSTGPEDLPRFYEAYVNGYGDFINGSRLVYPMEGEAMQTLNLFANIFFAKALSAILGVRITDSLCGTKLVARRDFERFKKWKSDFGDFDPFGDFELLFPAAILSLGIIDIPIHYKARTYGTTNIQRFRHGWILIRMVAIGLFRIRLGL
jgi:hypothetical protein